MQVSSLPLANGISVGMSLYPQALVSFLQLEVATHALGTWVLEDQIGRMFRCYKLFDICIVWFVAGHFFSGLYSLCLLVGCSSLLLLGCDNTPLHLLYKKHQGAGTGTLAERPGAANQRLLKQMWSY